MKKIATSFCILVFLTGISATLYASGQKSVPEKEKRQLERTELRREVVRVKYIRASRAYNLLLSYRTAGYGREIRYDNDLGILTIQDIPEIVDKMLAVLKEIDVKPVDLEFNVDLFLVAVSEDSKKIISGSRSKDPIIRELRSLMKLENFELLDKSFARVQENKRLEMLMGGRGMDFQLRLEPRYIRDEKAGLVQVEMRLTQLKRLQLEAKRIELKLINTTISIRSGERTIVGISKMDGGEMALVLVISGKVLK